MKYVLNIIPTWTNKHVNNWFKVISNAIMRIDLHMYWLPEKIHNRYDFIESFQLLRWYICGVALKTTEPNSHLLYISASGEEKIDA